MIVLGIETSTEVCAVGLANDDGAYAERALVESHIHSEKLLTLITEILEQQHTQLSELDAISVSIGPGSFTGLRIGLSTAKGLCFALGKPLVIVPTLEAMAMAVRSRNQARRRAAAVSTARATRCSPSRMRPISYTAPSAARAHPGTIAAHAPAARRLTVGMTTDLSDMDVILGRGEKRLDQSIGQAVETTDPQRSSSTTPVFLACRATISKRSPKLLRRNSAFRLCRWTAPASMATRTSATASRRCHLQARHRHPRARPCARRRGAARHSDPRHQFNR